MQADVAVLELNPRILSNWVILLRRRAAGTRTVIWGHAAARHKVSPLRRLARRIQAKLASVLLAYTDCDRDRLQAWHPGARIITAPNSLYYRTEIGACAATSVPVTLLYSGRLIPEKKPRLLLRAFLDVLPLLPSDIDLVFVGDGPERSVLQRSLPQRWEQRIHFLGPITGEERLRALYAQALFTVSPGYAGLSVIQSLSHGVPMIAPKDETHAPEVCALSPGSNALFFRIDDPSDLARVIRVAVADRDRWRARRTAIAAVCADTYSVDQMIARFLAAAGADEGGRT